MRGLRSAISDQVGTGSVLALVLLTISGGAISSGRDMVASCSVAFRVTGLLMSDLQQRRLATQTCAG
jgi:hypothetical protein